MSPGRLTRPGCRAGQPAVVLGVELPGGLLGGGGLDRPVLLGAHPGDRLGEDGALGQQRQQLADSGVLIVRAAASSPDAARSPEPADEGSGSRPHACRAARS